MRKLFDFRLFCKFTPATVLVIFLTVQTILAVGSPPRLAFLDFSGDRRSDFVVIRNNGGARVWDILRNQDTSPDVRTTFTYGGAADQAVPGDYFNDLWRYEVSYYRRSQATFFTGYFSDYMTSVPYPTLTAWGQAGEDARYYGDYDGDRKDDLTVLRYQPSTGLYYWYIKGSKGTNYTYLFGSNNPETYEFAFRGADYNGDGRDEVVLCYVNISTGQAVWYFGDPITQTLVGVHAFGNYYEDFLVNPADYTGDGKAELAIWRRGKLFHTSWQTYSPTTAVVRSQNLLFYLDEGAEPVAPPKIPISGDFDGDGVYDVALYKRTTSEFQWISSSTRNPQHTSWPFGEQSVYRTFGIQGDYPVAGLWSY